MNLLNKDGKSNALTNFNNPFDKNGVTSVTFNIHRKPSMFREGKNGEAIVYFSKNNTDGKHTFYADDFQDLVKQVDAFINSLK
jgi:hypothetical protein